MDDFHCSFCGKRRREVFKLISGPRVFICNECVILCREIAGPRPPPAAEPEAPAPEPAEQPPDQSIRWREILGTMDGKVAGVELARIYGVPFTDLEEVDVDEEILRLVPDSIAHKYGFIPIARLENRLTLAMLGPKDEAAIAAAREATGLDIEPTVAAYRALQDRLKRHYPLPPVEGPHCSFCGKAKSEVGHLVKGPTVFICNQCVELCEDIVAEEREKQEGA